MPSHKRPNRSPEHRPPQSANAPRSKAARIGPKKIGSLLGFVALLLIIGFAAQPAQAQTPTGFYKTYKVQVEYWFFDTDYYYWSTVHETADLAEALFIYDLLLAAKRNRELNEVAANSYGRYIAVDVRMITQYHYPQFQRTPTNSLSPVRNATLLSK